jgi:pimeloyl-ACP methyl ester carboxylesterase
MPYANSDGVRIHYEVEGDGPPLVLAHGIMGNLNIWRQRGYADALRNDYKLILFDARGHGLSEKPHDPSDYGMKMTHDVVAVLDDIGINEAHYFGYSMGAAIGFRVATQHSERFRSFILGGWSPYRNDPDAGPPDNTRRLIFEALLTDPDAAVALRERMLGRAITPEERGSLLANDGAALLAVMSSVPNLKNLTNQELSRISVPCLLFCGDVDAFHSGAKEAADHIPRAAFVSLPGLDHFQSSERSGLVLPHVKEFLAEVVER